MKRCLLVLCLLTQICYSQVIRDYPVGDKITWSFTLTDKDTIMIARVDTSNVMFRYNYIEASAFLKVEPRCVAVISVDRDFYNRRTYNPRLYEKQPRLAKMFDADGKLVFAISRQPINYIHFRNLCEKLVPRSKMWEEIENGPNVSIIVRSSKVIFLEGGAPGDIIRPSEVSYCILRY